ncbi:MAG: zinc-binding alcohol dehydrogenase, partial [Marinilabiliales bacterium]
KGGIYITSLPRPKLLFHKLVSIFTGKSAKTLLMNANSKDMAWLSKQFKDDQIKVIIDKVFSLSDIANAHQYSQEGHAEGKIVIKIQNQ